MPLGTTVKLVNPVTPVLAFRFIIMAMKRKLKTVDDVKSPEYRVTICHDSASHVHE